MIQDFESIKECIIPVRIRINCFSDTLDKESFSIKNKIRTFIIVVLATQLGGLRKPKGLSIFNIKKEIPSMPQTFP
jgi:hypothetical protein